MDNPDPAMVIRDAVTADAAAIQAIYAPIVTDTAISFEEEPPTVEEISRRIEASHVWLVYQDGIDVTGYAYASPFHPRAAYRWSVEVSVYIGERARGRGMGRQLLTAMLARLESIGFVNVFGGVALPNEASVRLFESLGFVKIAHQKQVGFKLGEWRDVAWWQLQLREPPIPPPKGL